METTTIVIIVILLVAAVVLAVALTNYFTEKGVKPAPAPIPESNDGYYLNQDGLVNKRAFLRNILVDQDLANNTGRYYGMTMLASGFVWMDSANKLAYIKYDGVDYYLASDTYIVLSYNITPYVIGKIYDMTTSSPGVDTAPLYTVDGDGMYMVSLYKNPVDDTVAIMTAKINNFLFNTLPLSRDIESSNPYKWKSGIVTFNTDAIYYPTPNGTFQPSTTNSSFWCSTFSRPMPNPLGTDLLPCATFGVKFTGETNTYYTEVDFSDNNDIKINYVQQDLPAKLVFNGTVNGEPVEFPYKVLNDAGQSTTDSSGAIYTLIGASYIYLSSTSVLDNIEYTPNGATTATTLYWNNVAAETSVQLLSPSDPPITGSQTGKVYTFDSASPTSNTINYNGEGLYLVGVFEVTGETTPSIQVMSYNISRWGIIGSARVAGAWDNPDTEIPQTIPYNYELASLAMTNTVLPSAFKFRVNSSWGFGGNPAITSYLQYPGGDIPFTQDPGDYKVNLNVQDINNVSYTLTFIPPP